MLFKHLNKKTFEGYTLSKYNSSKKIFNVSPGPAPINSNVLNKIKKDLKTNNHGITSLEISHRSPEFNLIKNEAESNIRKFMKIPDNFSLIWTQGGGHGQFSAIPLNLNNIFNNKSAHYIVSGTWSERAEKEAKKFTNVTTTYSCNNKNSLQFNSLPIIHNLTNHSYVYLCSNETVNGLEYSEDRTPLPSRDILGDSKLVVDMSSDFGTKIVDWNKIDVAFACSSKNLGTAGTTLLIIRDNIINKISSKNNNIPCVLDWKLYYETNSLYNTPPIFNIYLINLVFKNYIKEYENIENIDKINKQKASLIYNCIDNHKDINISVTNKLERSYMNIPFTVDNLNDFLYHCYTNNLIGLRTKTPFDWNKFNLQEQLRISLYNGISLEDTHKIKNIINSY